jgi:hypothetical protein
MFTFVFILLREVRIGTKMYLVSTQGIDGIWAHLKQHFLVNRVKQKDIFRYMREFQLKWNASKNNQNLWNILLVTFQKNKKTIFLFACLFVFFEAFTKMTLLEDDCLDGPALFPVQNIKYKKNVKCNRKKGKKRKLRTTSTDRAKRRKATIAHKNKMKKLWKQKHFCPYCLKFCAKGKKRRNIKDHNKKCKQYQKAAKKRKRANAAYAKKKKDKVKNQKDHGQFQ